MTPDQNAFVSRRDGHAYSLDDHATPHVIRDGIDIGVATPFEEAMWAEIIRLRELASDEDRC